MTVSTQFAMETTVLTAAGAQAVIAAALAQAEVDQLAVSVAVVDGVGNLVAFHRMDRALTIGIDVSMGKARASAQFGAPSKIMEDLVDGGKPSFLGVGGMTPIQGGMPLFVGGKLLGGVGVSGGQAHQDEAIATAGAAALG